MLAMLVKLLSGGGLFGATGEHGTELCNLIVNPALLRLKAFDGGGDDFVRELGCGQVSLSHQLRQRIPHGRSGLAVGGVLVFLELHGATIPAVTPDDQSLYRFTRSMVVKS
jgi:hypothetical protein